MTVKKLGTLNGKTDSLPIIYVGDTVADMYTVLKARTIQPDREFIAVGVLPPHVQTEVNIINQYTESLRLAGANIVINNVKELTPDRIQTILNLRADNF